MNVDRSHAGRILRIKRYVALTARKVALVSCGRFFCWSGHIAQIRFPRPIAALGDGGLFAIVADTLVRLDPGAVKDHLRSLAIPDGLQMREGICLCRLATDFLSLQPSGGDDMANEECAGSKTPDHSAVAPDD